MESGSLVRNFVESLYASLFFASIITTAFYGVTCMQSVYYFSHYQDDPLGIKLLVATLWGLDTLHEALTISGAYKFILSGVLNPLSLLNGIPEFIVQLLTMGLAAVLAQGYFAYRIYVVSGKNIFPPLIWSILGCYQIACTIAYVCKALYFSDGVHVVGITTLDNKFFTTIATSTLSIGAGVDILIAVSLTYLLLRKRTASGFASTAHVLQRLVLFSLNTGSWTALFALLVVILMHTSSPTRLTYMAFAIPLCSVYCNTVLANLNARQYIRSETIMHNVNTEQAIGSRRIEVIMVSTDKQKEKMSISSTPLSKRNTASFTDGMRSETSENGIELGQG